MKTAALKALLVASLRTADPVGTSRRVVAALAAKERQEARVQRPAEEDMQPFRTALAGDLRPVAEALWQASRTDDAVAMRAGLRKISRSLVGMDAPALAAELALASAKAFSTKPSPETEP